MDFAISDALTELIGFLASFLVAGAVGFRFIVLRGDAAAEESIGPRADRRAALFGLAGALVNAAMYGLDLRDSAAEQHKTVWSMMTAGGGPTIRTLCVVLMVLGFAFAVSHLRAGWGMAAAGLIVSPLSPMLSGKLLRMVNPLHRLAGGLWIGTLFILLVAGLATVATSGVDAERRGRIAANMVHRFSPLALSAFGLLAITGVITAWTHLKRIDSLWTTAYGWTLIVKLCVVAVVIALGGYNWKRQRPLLGTEAATAVLRRSATLELAAASIVLIITSVLVSLPSPD